MTRQGNPVAMMSFRSSASVTTAGSGNSSMTVHHGGGPHGVSHAARTARRSAALTTASALISPTQGWNAHGPHAASTASRSWEPTTPSPLMSESHSDRAEAMGEMETASPSATSRKDRVGMAMGVRVTRTVRAPSVLRKMPRDRPATSCDEPRLECSPVRAARNLRHDRAPHLSLMPPSIRGCLRGLRRALTTIRHPISKVPQRFCPTDPERGIARLQRPSASRRSARGATTALASEHEGKSNGWCIDRRSARLSNACRAKRRPAETPSIRGASCCHE